MSFAPQSEGESPTTHPERYYVFRRRSPLCQQNAALALERAGKGGGFVGACMGWQTDLYNLDILPLV